MLHHWGEFTSRYWALIVSLWMAAFIGLRMIAPPFDELAKGGEFVFLPESMPSRQGETLLNKAFPGRQTTSSIVIVVHREEGDGLTDDDYSFIENKLTPSLQQLRDRFNGTGESSNANLRRADGKETKLIADIHDSSQSGIGKLLNSEDGKSSLVTLDLATDFQDPRNWEPVQSIAEVLTSFEKGDELPKGLQLALTGSATLGRDLTSAEAYSARNTGPLTITLVVILLVVIYRAPLLAIVPLLTLVVAVDVALHLLTVLAQAGYVPLFRGLKEYATVISYGPGIDYCLFLIARYKENLYECVPSQKALASAVGQVGSAIIASAATVICGIGMLTFAQFGKFHQAGIGISLTLLITLLATLTLTPALLAMVGHWAFWPKPGFHCDDVAGKAIAGNEDAVQTNLFQPLWTRMGQVIERRPLALLLGTTAGMLPFVAIALLSYGRVNYGLLESLPASATSAAGARVLESHFSAGITGPVTILLQNPKIDFREEEGIAVMRDLTQQLMKRREELNVSDIRSVAAPLGFAHQSGENDADGSSVTSLVERKAARVRSVEHYVTDNQELDGHVTEMEIIIGANPFSMESVRRLDALVAAVRAELPGDQAATTTITVVGPTASVRDISAISQSDQERIYLLVVGSVLAILVILLRSLSLSLYLIATVLLSYLATLGATWLFFYCLAPTTFAGLDWTVPLFLFVVLIAVGEDYNIFLVTRIHEEQQRLGRQRGITTALSRTGGIITSCGVIMAGTFATLGIGSLARMQQLGFALAVGVLLDTFVIRPILVPAFLMLFHNDVRGLSAGTSTTSS